VGDHRGAPYLVTECLEGGSLRARLGTSPLSVDAALDVALQVARGLGAAHERGIVHRDLKPENIFLAQDGRAKILDFGLATLRDHPAPQTSSEGEVSGGTTQSLAGGTAGYMAPEQVRGEAVDPRADIFALGAVLYEMLANRPPFTGKSTFEILQAVLTAQPDDLQAANPQISSGLSDLVRRCLAKSRDERFATVGEVAAALEAIVQARKPAPPATMLARVRRPVLMATLLLAVIAMSAGVWRWRVATARIRWARTVAAPEVERLIREQRTAEAFVLARKALEAVPEDPYLRQLWLDVSLPGVLTTDPAGADVAIAPYQAAVTEWSPLGQTPLQRVPIPRGLFRLRISKAGFQTIEGTGAPGALQRYRLDPVAEVPPGMVRVVRGRVRFGAIGDLDDFWIDRFEVTNRQFKDFVDQGGYRRRDYWREAFHEGSRTLPWEAAMEKLRDTTGQPGPATWASGTYPDGQADFPVGGVSWYEAAAYAAFAGKSLPTVYHWHRAAALGRFADILAAS
ncbi:MAG TPA: protein kinase, partial [Myxococcales bacterium]|nr:protein kinase [Myxococcales bacterium]